MCIHLLTISGLRLEIRWEGLPIKEPVARDDARIYTFC